MNDKMSERERFEIYCKSECDPDSGGFADVHKCFKCKIKWHKTRLAKSDETVKQSEMTIDKLSTLIEQHRKKNKKS